LKTKIYHGFRQWCAPLTPGMHVVGSTVQGLFATDISKPGIKASAFLSADGNRLVVHTAAVQDQDADLELRIPPPFSNSSYHARRTGKDEDFAELPSGRVSSGRISTRLPGRAMLTLVFDR
jgi:hypothetical protein